jgi:hypothetical protein
MLPTGKIPQQYHPGLPVMKFQACIFTATTQFRASGDDLEV